MKAKVMSGNSAPGFTQRLGVAVKMKGGWKIRLENGRLLPNAYPSKEAAQQRIRQMKQHSKRIATKPAGTRVQVTFNGEVIADSRDGVEMKEGDYPVVYYIPRQDVKMDRLVRSNHQTYCPFKGTASYHSLKNGPENAVWSYEEPYDEMRVIKGLLAFYPDKVDSITAM